MLYIVNIFAPFMIQQEFCLNLRLFINTLPQSPFLLQFLQFQLIIEMNLQLRKMSFKLNMNEPTGILRKLFMKGVDMHFCLLDLRYLFVDPLDFRYHRLNYMTYSCMSLCMISWNLHLDYLKPQWNCISFSFLVSICWFKSCACVIFRAFLVYIHLNHGERSIVMGRQFLQSLQGKP